jgi:hypothetical protein
MEKVGIDIQANFTDNASQGMDNLAQRLRQRVQQMESATRDYESSVERFALTRKSNLKTQLQSQVEAKYGRIESISAEIEKEGLAGRPEIIAVTDRERLERARAIYKAQSEGLISGRKPRAVDNPFSFSVMNVESYGSTELLRANISELKKGTLGTDEKGAFTSVSQDLLSRIRSRYSSGLTRGLSELESEKERIGKLPAEQQQAALDELSNKQDRLVKTSIASARSIQEFSDSLTEFSEKSKKAQGGLPSYFMAAVGAVLQVAQSAGQLYHLNRTSFNLDSPAGMANALYGREMGQRSILGQGIGSALGGGIGLAASWALAPATGGMSLLAGMGAMYAGSQIGGGLGSTWASIANTGTEVEQKKFNSAWTKTQQNVAIANQAQTASANLRRFKNIGEAGFLGLDESQIQQAIAQNEFGRIRGGNDIGAFSEARILAGRDRIPFAEIAPIAGQYKFTKRDIGIKGFDAIRSRTGMEGAGRESELVKGILSIQQMSSSAFSDPASIAKSMNYLANLPTNLFENESEFGKLGEAGLSKINALSGMVTSSSNAQEALLFRAIKQQNPNATFNEVQLQMREGLANPKNMQALLDTGYLRNKSVAQQYLMSTTTLSSQDIKKFSDEMESGSFKIASGNDVDIFGRTTNTQRDEALTMGRRALTAGEIGAQTVAQSNIGAGMGQVKWVTDFNVEFQLLGNTFATNTKTITMMKTELSEAINELQKFINLAIAKPDIIKDRWAGARDVSLMKQYDTGR